MWPASTLFEMSKMSIMIKSNDLAKLCTRSKRAAIGSDRCRESAPSSDDTKKKWWEAYGNESSLEFNEYCYNTNLHIDTKIK
jgi:hypothetical protein